MNTTIRPIRRWTGLAPIRRALSPAVLLVVAASPALAAWAQDPAPGDTATLVSLDRLRFEYKCYFDIPEWKGKGETSFLKKLEAQKPVYKATKAAEVPALEGLMAVAYWKLKEECEAKGDADGADSYASLITKLESKGDKVVSEYIDRADSFVIGRNFEKAKKMEAAGNDAEARKAFVNILGAKDKSIGQQAVTALVRIVSKQRNYQAVLDSNDLTEIGGMLDAVLADLKGDLTTSYEAFLNGTGGYTVNAELKNVADEKARNAGSTQDLQVAWRDVSAAIANVKGTIEDVSKATFRMDPEGEGKPFPATGVSAAFKRVPFKWYRGTYTVRAFAPGAERPFATLRGVSLGDAPGTAEFPNRVPVGMVWCPPLKAGGEALFVDRNEVTVAEVEAVAGADEALLEVARESRGMNAAVTERYPAWFWKATQIEGYEKATGKSVPTDGHWLHAAFGGRDSQSHPFPWGKEPLDGTRAFTAGSREFPDSVGGRVAGASPCGAEDMAGNVAEWVRKDGKYWLLGGYYLMTDGQLGVYNAKIPLRDPMPGKDAYAAMDSAQQNAYLKYKINEVDEAGYLVGLRMVVPVPAK